jgi:hypothetical protein
MQELTSMNVQMRLITADNIEQLTKQGDRIINDRANITNNSPAKEEDIYERLKRENIERKIPTNANIKDGKQNNNNFQVEPELLTSEEKKQLINMNPQTVREFIDGHTFADLTPIQKENFNRIVQESKYYMRLETEEDYTNEQLYKTILQDEIDKMLEPTQSNINALAELNRLNQNLREGQTSNQPLVINKVGSTSSNEEQSPMFIPKSYSNEESGQEDSGQEESGDESSGVEESKGESESTKKVIKLS